MPRPLEVGPDEEGGEKQRIAVARGEVTMRPETLALIRDRVPAHLIVDGDTGYGNAVNVFHMVRAFEQAGLHGLMPLAPALPG